MMKNFSVVWFKRDLRVADHAPLWHAHQRGPILALYIDEPMRKEQADYAMRHDRVKEPALQELASSLEEQGLKLHRFSGEPTAILRQIHDSLGPFTLFSHEETGNHFTYQRDKKVKNWCKDHQISWHEFRQFGVVRGLKTRSSGWSKQWQNLMNETCLPIPRGLRAKEYLSSQQEPNLIAAKTPWDTTRAEGLRLLHSFCSNRGVGYQKHISSPLTAFGGSSRLSAHISLGTLSLREIYQTIQQSSLPPRDKQAVLSRLHWHCHFIQKLETEPAIEFRSFHPLYQDLRTPFENENLHQSWAFGQTGWPFVDACMRCLQQTGWLNFRMRAMLTSVASYHLFQPWRHTAVYLAKLFSDYEPGIHYSQIQMQSGTTGINTLRIYNPIKQGYDQDPKGKFVMQWVPELRTLPAPWCHEPWKAAPLMLADSGIRLGHDYPWPIVDHLEAAKIAKERITQLRRSERKVHHEISDHIQKRHGSQRSGMRRTGQKKAPNNQQIDLFKDI